MVEALLGRYNSRHAACALRTPLFWRVFAINAVCSSSRRWRSPYGPRDADGRRVPASSDRRAELPGTQEIVRRTFEEVRRIPRDLRPQMLDDLGLVSSLTERVAGFSRRTCVPVERAGDANIARRSRANHVLLSSTGRRDGVTLRLVDDGCARTQAGREGHGGVGMRERAVFVGGALAINAGPSGVSRYAFEVPAVKEL